MMRDRCESIVPAHGHVMIGGSVVRHRMGEATDHFEFVVPPSAEFGNAMSGEEFEGASIRGCFPCDRLATILAIFERRCVFRIGPGAAGTVETSRLVHVRQRRHAVYRDALL